jgi:hypothetical protein
MSSVIMTQFCVNNKKKKKNRSCKKVEDKIFGLTKLALLFVSKMAKIFLLCIV